MQTTRNTLRIGAFLISAFLSIGLEAHQQASGNDSDNKALTHLPIQKVDSTSYYLIEPDKTVSTDHDEININQVWASYYFDLDQKDSAFKIISLNLNYLFLKGNDRAQLALAKTYVFLDRLSNNGTDFKTYISRLRNAIHILEEQKPESEDLSWAYLRLGVRLWYNEQYNEAEPWWQKAYQHSKKYGFRPIEIKALHHQGFVYVKQRKMSLSKSHYKYLLSLIDASSEEYYESKVLAMNALGTSFNANNELDSAIFYFNKGLNFLIKHREHPTLHTSFLENRALFSHNLGNALRKTPKAKEAIKWLNLALESNEAVYGKNSTQLIRTLRDLGQAYQKTDQPNLAASALLRALEISKNQDFDQTRSYSQIAHFYQNLGKYNTALDYFDSALVKSGYFLNSNKDVYVYSSNLFFTLSSQSYSLASARNVPLNKLERAYDQFTETIRFAYGKSDSDGTFQEIPQVLENYYTAYNRLYQEDGDKKWLSKLWEIMELNKAVTLRNQLNAENSLKYAIPEQLLRMEKSLKDSISLLISRQRSIENDSTLFLLNRRYNSFLGTMEKDFPKYYTLKNQLDVTSLSELRHELDKQTLLFNFFEGQKYVHIIRLDGEAVFKHKILKKEINTLIEQHNNAVFNRSYQDIVYTSEKIREKLHINSQDLESNRHLYIIPDGLIWNLNFASIATNKEIVPQFMGYTHTISYHYFANKKLSKENKHKNNLLAFSFSESSSPSSGTRSAPFKEDEAPIPGTSAELRSIAKLWEGNYYFSKNANESNFKSLSGSYSILHLAVHGFLDEKKPENSYLKFASADSLNDGKLHVYEIYNLDLNADLAVLSACHSGNGKIVAGEGMMSLGRAFAYAGVRSLLISRWEVSDYSAPHLMEYFYQGLKEGMYKSEALKFAQTEYLKKHSDVITSSPFYWSSFYVLGDDSPIYQEAGFNPWIIGLILLLVSSGTVIYSRKRVRKAQA